MTRIAWTGLWSLLAAGAWGCGEPRADVWPPPTTQNGQTATGAREFADTPPAAKTDAKPRETREDSSDSGHQGVSERWNSGVRYPGGTVWRDGEKISSQGTSKAAGTSAQQKLMARRAAYLIAVRNAGLYLSGLRASGDGRLQPTKDGAIPASLTVRDFREAASAFDEKTRIATVTIEIPIPEE